MVPSAFFIGIKFRIYSFDKRGILMHISYEELIHIKGMEQAQIVAGRSGTWRKISGAHVVELVDAQKWVKEGELVFISGVGLKQIETELDEIVKTVSSRNVSGVVLEMGPFIKRVPESVIKIANHYGMPILKLPFEISVGDVISKIYYLLYNQESKEKSVEDLMESVIYGKEDIYQEKVRYYGFNEKIKHVAICIGVDHAAEIMDEQLKKTLLNSVKKIFAFQNLLLYLRDGNHIVMILDLPDQNEEVQIKDLIEQYIIRLNQELYSCHKTISIGVGKYFHKVVEMRKSVIEAKKAYKILRSCKVECGARYYEEIGVYQLFFNHKPEELKEFAQDILGPIRDYDRMNDSELFDTLRVYLESNCNMSIVTEKIYVHRNTVKYRIKRIEEILGYDLSNVNRQFNLRLAYKIIKYLT